MFSIQFNDKPRYIPGGKFSPVALGGGNRPGAITNVRQEAANMRMQNYSSGAGGGRDSADALKAMMKNGSEQVIEKLCAN